MMDKVNLAAKLARIDECWSPKVVGELNGQLVKLAKCHGAYPWHHHADEDELFLVLDGRLRIELEERTVELGEGEFFVVPRGTPHRPVADEESAILLFEPAGTRNTGQLDHELTIEPEDLERL
jgi:mannose-6-phosphate isomerase-like protein (cupin superfamily)